MEPKYAYNNFIIDIDTFKYTISYLGLTVCFFSLKLKRKELDSIAWFFYFLVVYVPLSSYYGMTNANNYWFMVVTLVWIIGNILINSPILNFKFSYPKINQKWVYWIGLSLALSLVILIIYSLDLNFKLSLSEVYEIREKKPTSFIPLSDYIINSLSKVVLPIIILLSIHYWNKFSLLVIGLSVFSIFIFFISTGHKGILFNIPFIIGIYFLMRLKDHFYVLSKALLFGILAIICITIFIGDNTLLSLIYRRTLMVPAKISFYYHEFYQDDALYLSNSIFSHFSHYPYALQPSYEIADYFFNRPEMASSNGLLSDGFRHFGYLGLFIWVIMFVISLKVLKGFTKTIAMPVVLTMALLFTKTIIDGPPLTTLLTHGFLFLFVIFFLIKPISRQNTNI